VSGPTLASGPQFLCRPMAERRDRSPLRIRQRRHGATEARPGPSMATCGSEGRIPATSITSEGRRAHARYAVDRRMDVVVLGAGVPSWLSVSNSGTRRPKSRRRSMPIRQAMTSSRRSLRPFRLLRTLGETLGGKRGTAGSHSPKRLHAPRGLSPCKRQVRGSSPLCGSYESPVISRAFVASER
jgi:hypothetical protein